VKKNKILIKRLSKHKVPTKKPPVPQRKPLETGATGRTITSEVVPLEASPLPERKPEHTLARSKDLDRRLLNFVGKLESSDNYNIIAGETEESLTGMTIKQVRDLQRNLQKKGAASTALGRYQIKGDTLDYLIRRMKLNGNEVFDEKMQDSMGVELLRRKGIERFKNGSMSTNRFIRNMSQEWAALPENDSNKSYHGGVGNNKALVDFKIFKNVVENK
jgi:hypothetical protein